VVDGGKLRKFDYGARGTRLLGFVAVLLFGGLMGVETKYESVFSLIHSFVQSVVYDHDLEFWS
jgi:hypothetical protein